MRLLALAADRLEPTLFIRSGVVDVEAWGEGNGLPAGDLAIPSNSFARSLTLGPLLMSIPAGLSKYLSSLFTLVGDLDRVGVIELSIDVDGC
jgi:hypothetical protein